MPGRDALSPLFLSADTCTGVQVVCVCVHIFVFVSVCVFVIAQKCQLNAQISLCLHACVCVLQCVHNVSVSALEPDQPRWKQQAFFSSVQIKVRNEA